MPIVLQHICDSRLREQERVMDHLRQRHNDTVRHKDALLQIMRTSHSSLDKERDMYREQLEMVRQNCERMELVHQRQRDESHASADKVERLHQQQLEDFRTTLVAWEQIHQRQLHDWETTTKQHQANCMALAVAMVVVVLLVVLFACYLLHLQNKEKYRLERHNHQYERDVKETMQAQKSQYQHMMEEYKGRIETLEKERVDGTKITTTSNLSQQQPFIYAFHGMPQLTSGCASSSMNGTSTHSSSS